MSVKVYDKFVSKYELQDIVQRFKTLQWNLWEYDGYPGYEKKSSGMTAELDNAIREILDPKILSKTDLNVWRAYVNAFKPNDIAFPHTDDSRETVLIYCNENYDIAYGGETVFFDDNKDAEKLVTPRFGRAVWFPGEIMHCARPFNSLSPDDYRFTIAYKLIRS